MALTSAPNTHYICIFITLSVEFFCEWCKKRLATGNWNVKEISECHNLTMNNDGLGQCQPDTLWQKGTKCNVAISISHQQKNVCAPASTACWWQLAFSHSRNDLLIIHIAECIYPIYIVKYVGMFVWSWLQQLCWGLDCRCESSLIMLKMPLKIPS